MVWVGSNMLYKCLRTIRSMDTDPVNLAKMAMNKMKYKLFQAAYDPEAEKMAASNKSEEKKPREETLLEKIQKKIPKIFNRGGEGYAQPNNREPNLPAPPKPKPTPTDQFITGFTTTFNTFILPVLIVFLCSLAGSIAANDAIGRSPGIRLVYFIYGTIPIFSPLVLIYYIFRYFMKTYPVWYNFLPLTTWQPESSILKTLLTPFVYTEDANTQYMFQQFDKAAKKWVAGGVANSNNNSTSNGSTGASGATGTSGTAGASEASEASGATGAAGAAGASNNSKTGLAKTNKTSNNKSNDPTNPNTNAPTGVTGSNNVGNTGVTGSNNVESENPIGPTGV